MTTAVHDRPPVDARPASKPGVSPVERERAVPRWLLPLIVSVGIALRVWRVLSNGLTFDESFTAMAGRRPVGDLFSYLRFNDSHPPLDYLLRVPFARAGASDLLLRSPSLLFSCAAVALFAWWMRARGWFGVIATALMAVSTFQLVYGGEARMYALLQLLGVAAAILTERWLRRPETWHVWAISALLLVALFDHVSGGLLAAGLLAAAGLRRDRAAWHWRFALGGVGLLWFVTWGPSVIDQLDARWASWIPRTTPMSFVEAVSRQVTLALGFAPFVIAAVAVGGVLLCRRDRVLGRVWVALGVVPFVLAAFIGLFAPFLFDRTLMLSSWAPIIGVAFALDVARRRFALVGFGVAVVSVSVIAALTCSFLISKRWEEDVTVARLEHVVRDGDVIAVRPARYSVLTDWRIGVRGSAPVRTVAVEGLDDVSAVLVGNRSRTGRIWLLTPAGDTDTYEAFARCAPTWRYETKKLLCLRR